MSEGPEGKKIAAEFLPINKKHVGGSFEAFLKHEGLYDEVMELVAKKRLAIQFEREMKKKKMTKTQLAAKLSTSRAQVNRILSADNAAVSIETVEKAAKAIGCRLTMVLEPIPSR